MFLTFLFFIFSSENQNLLLHHSLWCLKDLPPLHLFNSLGAPPTTPGWHLPSLPPSLLLQPQTLSAQSWLPSNSQETILEPRWQPASPEVCRGPDYKLDHQETGPSQTGLGIYQDKQEAAILYSLSLLCFFFL